MARIYVDARAIRDNRRLGRNRPVIKVEVDGQIVLCHKAELVRDGRVAARVIYCLDGPAPQVWVETDCEVVTCRRD